MIERIAGGQLAGGTVPGWDGGTASGLGGQVLWDTRDCIFAASSGQYHTLSMVFFGRTLGSEYTFVKTKFDLRTYLPLSPVRSLALQAMGVFINGTAPFRELGRLGGSSTLRGYYEGRYRDNQMLVAQAEFRTAVIGRFGAVAFAGAGTVAHEVSMFELRAVRASAGIGVRYAFDPEERLNMRMDIGWGTNSSGMYFVASEAF
jgi:outer membrane protein assembly factor BamA